MASAAHAMASVHTAHMQGGPLFSGPPVVPPVGLEPTRRGSAHPAVIVGIRRFFLAGVGFMRPLPFFQSLPVFICFDHGLRFFVSKLCPNSLGTRLKLPPRSSSYIYSIACAAYPAALGTGSSPLSMSSSVPSGSPLTRRMRSSASIWSRVHHVQSCPSASNSIPQHRRSNGCVTTGTRAPHWLASALCATVRNAPPTDTAGGSQTNKRKNSPAPLTVVASGAGRFLRILGLFSGILRICDGGEVLTVVDLRNTGDAREQTEYAAHERDA